MIRASLLLAIVAACSLFLAVPTTAQQFQLGDVIVSGSIPNPSTQQFRTKVLWYGPDGQLKKVLVDSEAFSSYELAFSPGGILHTISDTGFATISPSGTIAALLVKGFYTSFAFAADGTFLAGYSGGMKRFNPSGSLVSTYTVSGDVGALDLASDQCTVYYLGTSLKRFDLCQGTQLPDFLPVGGLDFRILPGGGLAISRPAIGGVEIYDSSGRLVRRIPAFARAIALDVDGTSLWIAMQGDGSLVKVDIASGTQLLGPILTGLPSIHGLAVYGEPRAAFVNGPLAAIPALSPTLLATLALALAALAVLRLRG